MSIKVNHVLVDLNGNWQFQNTSAAPTPQCAKDWSGRARTDCDIAQWRDQAEKVLFWIDANGYPRFPGDGSGVMPTPMATEIHGVAGYDQPAVILTLARPGQSQPIGGITYKMSAAAPNGYFGTLLTSLPANYPKPSF
jgi:hypothetical protein